MLIWNHVKIIRRNNFKIFHYKEQRKAKSIILYLKYCKIGRNLRALGKPRIKVLVILDSAESYGRPMSVREDVIFLLNGSKKMNGT